MAEEENESTAAPDPVVVLTKKAKTNRLLIIVLAVLLVVTISALGTGLGVMFTRISSLEPPPEMEIDERFIKLQEQLKELAIYRELESEALEKFRAKLELMKTDDTAEKAAAMEQLLAEREKDFQSLIVSMKSGAKSMAGMVRGSRDWLKVYDKKLDDLAVRSTERNKALTNPTAKKQPVKPNE